MYYTISRAFIRHPWYHCIIQCSPTITTTALLLCLHTHQTPNYLNSPSLPPRLPPRLPSNGAMPQPPPLNLPTRNTSRTRRYSRSPTPKTMSPIFGRVAESATRWWGRVISWTIGIISTTSGGGEVWGRSYG
jgi:hypothetical protein